MMMREPLLAGWTTTLQRSVLRQLIAVVSRPEITSFAGGLPDPTLFPREDYAEAMAQVLATDALALQYRPPFAPLRSQIANLMMERGVGGVSAENIFLTTGAQQALDVLCRLFLDNDRCVILEENIYTGIQQVIRPRQAQVLTVPTDLDTGIDVVAIEELLIDGHIPAFIYVIPDGHNPTGVTMSLSKRRRLVQLARDYQFVIIEDDPYGFLYYTDNPLPPLRALDDEWVFYVGSFSKTIAPALRLGWMLAPSRLIDKLTVIKEACDLESSALTQRAVATYLQSEKFEDHLAHLRAAYKGRRDTLLKAIEQHFPANAHWTIPEAGMFVWVQLDKHIDTNTVLHTAVQQEKVAFVPGHAFAFNPNTSRHCLRLTFSTCTVEQIEDGIKRLGQVLSNFAS